MAFGGKSWIELILLLNQLILLVGRVCPGQFCRRMTLGCGSGVTPDELGCPSFLGTCHSTDTCLSGGNCQGADGERLQGPGAFAPGPGVFAAEKSSPFLLPPWPSPLGIRGSRSSPVTSEADPPGAQATPSLRMYCPFEARSSPASSVPRVLFDSYHTWSVCSSWAVNHFYLRFSLVRYLGFVR